MVVVRAWCRLGAMAAIVSCVACGRTDNGQRTGDGDSDSGLTPCELDPDLDCTTEVRLQRAADILFVIDNSGSMGEEQGTLAANFAAFIDVLERDQVGANYRIGITTTDSQGLRATSCRQRLFEFIWEGTLNDEYVRVDAQADGCLNSCAYDDVPLLPSLGTDDSPSVPWLEKNDGQTNLPPGFDIAAALQCIGPQGINGFGFEGPMESMRRVLVDEPQGFVRDSALLAVIFVTDEADCSMPSNNQLLLSQDFSRALWSDPLDDGPTSAVCWNAGVECDGGPGIYDSCYSVDRGWDAELVSDPSEAVLYPVERYLDTLREVSRGKEQRGGNGQVLVGVIAGVPLDYAEGGELVYQDSDIPDFNREYGIGPGCNRGTESVGAPPGIPPVRLLEFAEAFASDRRNLFSICSPDYTVALEDIADAIANLSQRACVPGCVKDTIPNVTGVQPQCEVVEQRVDGTQATVQRCILTNDGWLMPPGQEVCYRMLGDPDGRTRTPADDMTPQCITLGANLEVVLERPEGMELPSGAAVQVDCELAGPIGTTCEELGLE